ncbi:MAG: sugar phosphate isomerase/epimerase family protein [Bacilli bacterium]
MVTLTAFADEISADLTEQLDVLEAEGIRHIELRSVWNRNVLDLSDGEWEQVRTALHERSVRVSAIGSPIGKIGVADDFESHLRRFKRAAEAAEYFDTQYIRIFSFFIPAGSDPAAFRNEVMRRIQVLEERARDAGLTLLHENEKEIYGDTGERCLDIFRTCPSERLRCAFDPANFVQCGVRPFSDAFPLLEPYISYVHIKDARFDGGLVVPAGQGDGEVEQVLSSLLDGGYDGFLSLEPHLDKAGRFSGFSGPERFRAAGGALKDMLRELGQVWN